MTLSRVIKTPEDVQSFCGFIAQRKFPFTAKIVDGEKRSVSQNALLHKWFGEVARQTEGETLIDVKGRAHRHYGLPIKMQDQQFAWVWERTGQSLSYEQQCAYLSCGILNVSSSMTAPQLREYMDAFARDHRAQGIQLTAPEDMMQ